METVVDQKEQIYIMFDEITGEVDSAGTLTSDAPVNDFIPEFENILMGYSFCWNCKRPFEKYLLNSDAGFGYNCNFCGESLRNHPIHGEK